MITLFCAGGGVLTPEDETKLLISASDHDHQQQPDRDNSDDNNDIKRPSSAGTYSLSSDSQTDCANTATGTHRIVIRQTDCFPSWGRDPRSWSARTPGYAKYIAS